MGFFKSALKVVTAPFTIPAKVASNVIREVSQATGLDSVPLVGNVLNAASKIGGTLDDVRRGKDVSQSLAEAGKAGLVVGATVLGGPIAGSIAGAKMYASDEVGSLFSGLGSSGGGILDALGAGLGIPPGTLSQFLPTNSGPSSTNYEAPGGGYAETASPIQYGVQPSKSNLFPVIAIGGAGVIAVILLTRGKK